MTPAPDSDLDEQVIEPDLPLIDAHHHLWQRPDSRYLLDEFAADLRSGHQVLATVYVECGSNYRIDGPEALKVLGEAQFVRGMAEAAHNAVRDIQVCAAFVGAVDLTLGHAVDDVLDGLAEASGGRLRGIRGSAAWDADPTVNPGGRPNAPQGMLLDPAFRSGFARLAPRGLVYDAWQYHPQLQELCDLADAFPDVTVVVNHCGGLLGVGGYADAANFSRWRACVTEVALRPNVMMKLGGLSRRRCGFEFEDLTEAPSAHTMAQAWKPYIDTCIELFSPSRCMFESNFPPDQVAGSYRKLWNALKLTVAHCSVGEKADLFHGTASRIYGIRL